MVRRIFELVGVQGSSIHGVARILAREGLTTPTGGRFWDVRVIRRFILDDVYKPHSFAEISELIDPEVAARLDPEKRYGIWWFNRRRIKKTQIAETGPKGRFYRKQSKLTVKPKDEWIAVPVPDSGIPREVVESAREAIRENRATSASGGRFWELSGGVLHCCGCGRNMAAHTAPSSQKARVKVRYCYYRWPKARNRDRGACLQSKNVRADKIEPHVWGFVSELLKNPERVRAGLDRLIAQEEQTALRGNPEREVQVWMEIIEADQMRSGYQDLAANGLMTYEELGEKLRQLDEARKTAERKLVELKERQERIQMLKMDKAELIKSFKNAVAEVLGNLPPEERHRIYKMLRLKVVVGADESIKISGAFRDHLSIGNFEPASQRSPRASSGSGHSPSAQPVSSARKGYMWRTS